MLALFFHVFYATGPAAEPRGNLSRRVPPVSQRLTALRAAEPRDDASSISSRLLRDESGGGAAGEFESPCPAGESETHRSAGGRAARKHRSISSHLLRNGSGGGAAGEFESPCPAGESETHRTAGGGAARKHRSISSHLLRDESGGGA